MKLETGTIINQYKILSPLGKGGMGEVFLAQDTKLDRQVALKILPSEFAEDKDRMNRFVREAKAASALNHPNIITVHDIGESEAGRFIVMELVAGHTLRTIIAQDHPAETVLALGNQIAKALSAAHAAGITHRDIKPDNIMVRDDGYVKVLDFGLARLRTTTESDSEAATLAQQTMPGTVMGTVAYMSPEQARGERVNHPSDIFALGIVLYELATGRHPFKAETLVGYLHAITLQEPAQLTKWKPELPVALNALILRMLRKDASQRPTASEVAQTLQDIERHGATVKPQSNEDATMMLPAAPTATSHADEGFWVAVLPFKWRGANAELEALAEGLSEDIVTGLSRFSYLRVIARGSTLRFASETSDVRAIGKELGARYVLEGSLRQAGSQLRVAVQLVDASTGAHLWTETYSRSFSPEVIFEIQDDLVPRIVSTVADWYGALPHSMSEAVRLKAPDQLSPYEAVLRGFGYFERIAPEEHAAVRAGLERAVAQAPGNADGWALLSMIYGEEHRFGFNAQPDPLGRSLQSARRAVDAGHANHFAWLALAQALFFRKEFAAFREAAERAIALNPMDGSTLEYLAHLLAFAGDWERGCDLAEQARQLNLNHPGWYWTVHFLDAYRQGDYQTARTCLLKGCMRGGGAQLFEAALLTALYGQLGERAAADKIRQTVLAAKPDFLLTLRSEFAKWYLPELVEQLMDGLRKAGLKVDEPERAITQQLEQEKDQSARPPVTSPAQSIAVLPFANISAEEENEYFCDGLAEELLNALAKIDELKVAARTSAFSFKGKNVEARDIGKTLNVNTVLEGSVRKSGNRIRINVQLVNAADGYHLWSERYDREMQDIFDVQDEITLAVVDALKLKLFGAEKATVLKRYTDNTEAYELYLKARFQLSKYTEAGWQKAIEYFEQALALEPDYAPAYVGIGEACGFLWYFGYDARPEVIARQRAAVVRALEIDAELADAYRSRAALRHLVDWNFSGAGEDFAQSVTLNPNDALTHAWHSFWLVREGHVEQAVTAARQARALDPFSLLSGIAAGWTLWIAQRYEEGISLAQTLLEMNPHFNEAFRLLGLCHLCLGDCAAAEEAMQKALAGGAGPVTLADLGIVYARAGKPEEARQILRQLHELRECSYVPALYLSYVYSSLGETEEAFVCLEKALVERNGEMVFLAVFPEWLFPPRQDPRFRDLLRRIGLPQ